MARTAPVPNIPPIPGMCPSVAVLGGGAGGGGGGGDGDANGNGDGPGNGSGDGSDASGDGRNAGTGCGDPVCPVTGRVFVDVYDFGLTSPLPLRWIRSYSSRACRRSGALGFGWSFSYGWTLTPRRSEVVLVDDHAREQSFPLLAPGDSFQNSVGLTLQHEADGYKLRDADARTFAFAPSQDGVHRLVSIQDPHANTIRFDRHPNGALRSIVDAAGRPYRISSDAEGRITSVSVPVNGNESEWAVLATYSYDDAGDLRSFTDPDGYIWRYDYVEHLLVAHRTPGGLTYHYRYDGLTAHARCIETWGETVGGDIALEVQPPPPPSGPDHRTFKGIQHIRLSYSADHSTEVTDSLGGVTRYLGDDQGRVVKVIDAAGGVTSRTLDPVSGAIVSEQSADGSRRFVQRVGRDSGGFQDDRGGSVVVSFDGEWEVVSDVVTGQVTRRRFDSRGSLLEVLHADRTHEVFECDSRGLSVRETSRLGVVSRFVHDAQGNLTEIQRPGGFERMEYDYWGRRVAHTDVFGRRTEWQWDRRGWIVGKTQPDGSRIRLVRDWFGNVTLHEQGGKTHRMSYGGVGWLATLEAPGGRVWNYRYDAEGHLTSVTAPDGQRHLQSYDHAGRAVRSVDFEGVERRVVWDAARRPVAINSPLGREKREYGPDGTLDAAETKHSTFRIRRERATRTISYDNGRVMCEQELDPMGQVVRDRQGLHETRVAWSGGMVAAMLSDVGVPVQLTRHPNGSVHELRGGAVELTLNRPVQRGGSLASWSSVGERDSVSFDQLGDALVLRRAYDTAGSLVSSWLARGTLLELEHRPLTSRADDRVILWAEYSYDHDAHLVGERHSDGVELRYTLDASGHVVERLRSIRGAAPEREDFAYDANGRVIVDGSSLDPLGRPAAYRGESFEYDAEGRLSTKRTAIGDVRYDWSDTGELLRVVAPDRVVELMYDARGRRVRKQVFRQRELVKEVQYVWSNNVVLHEIDVTSGTSRTFLRDEGKWEARGHVELVAGEQRPVFYLPHPSGLVTTAVDERGQVVFRGDVSLWGELRSSQGSRRVDARYPNQSYDYDVELTYNFRRWYDARVGHFVSQDPTLIDGSYNLRDYVPNPLAFMDPTGLLGPGMGHPGPPARQDGRPGGSSPLPRSPSASGGHVWGTPDGGRPPRPSPNDLGDRNNNYPLGPGHYATEGSQNSAGQWVPGYASCPPGFSPTAQGGWPRDLQQQVDNAGYTHGCHGCGTTDPGPSGHFVPDHQPTVSSQRAAAREAAAGRGSAIPASQVRYYPHCQNCAGNQANAQNRMAGYRNRNDAANAAHGRAQGARNAANQNTNNAGGNQSQAQLDAVTNHLGIQGAGGGAYQHDAPVAPGANNNVGDNRYMYGQSYNRWR